MIETVRNGYTEDYYSDLKEAIDTISKDMLRKIEVILRLAKASGSTVYLIGNGGSMSCAEHIAGDLTKLGGIKAVPLTNTALFTAYANDMSYQRIFVEQLKTYLRENDVLISISASGNSRNIIHAIKYAKAHKVVTIGFLGFEGGKAKDLVDYALVIPSMNYGIVEDLQLSFGHYLGQRLKKQVMEDGPTRNLQELRKEVKTNKGSMLVLRGGGKTTR